MRPVFSMGVAEVLVAALLVGALPALCQEAPTARQKLLEARQALARGEYDQALKTYQAALELAVDDNQRAQALLGMASTHRAQHDRRAELEALARIEGLAGADPAYGRAARRQMLHLYRGTGKLAEARKLAEKLLAEAEGFEERLSLTLELAEMDVEEGKAAEATRRLEPLVKEAQNSSALPEVLATLITARILNKQWPEALALIRQAARQFPERTDLLLRPVQMLRDEGRTEEAAGLLQEALVASAGERDAPATRLEVLRALFDLRREAGQTKTLTDWLDKQTRGVGREIWLEYLARVYEWDEQLAQAVAVYRRLMALHPRDGRLLTEGGQLALRAQEFAQAAQWLEEARALAPQDQNLVVLVGEAQLRQGHLQQALATWKQGLGYAADNPQSVQNVGNLLASHELYEAALEVYREGRLASRQPTAYALNMGSAHEQLGDFAGAVREYALALTTTERMPAVVTAAGQLYRLADEVQARPLIIAALEASRAQGALPPEGLGVLMYARVLEGESGGKVLETLTPRPPLPGGEEENGGPPPGPRPTGEGGNGGLTSVLMRVASRLESRQRPELALPIYERLMQGALPADQAAVMARRVAELQLVMGDWRSALATLQPWAGGARVSSLQPDLRAQLALQLGDVLLRYAHRPADASGAYEIAVQAAPESRWARLARWGQADALFALGDTAQALEEYGKLLRLGRMRPEPMAPGVPGLRPSRGGRELPEADYVAYQQAEALLRQGKAAEAGAAFHQLAADHPDSRYANDALQRVLLVQRLGQDPRAEAYVRALVAWDKGELEEAERLLRELIAQVPASVVLDMALMRMGELKAWQGDTQAAVATYDQLVARVPESSLAPRAAFAAAMIVGKTDKAQALERLKALVGQYGEATEAEEARVVIEAWEAEMRVSGKRG